MNTSALFLMILVWVPVITLTVYFFIKILRTPKKKEPDSYTNNDDE